MATLPFILPSGHVSLYGYGTERGQSGIIPGDTKYKFASIYDVSPGGDINVYPGQSVMFNQEDKAYILLWNGWPYTVIRADKLGGIELIDL